MFDELRPPVTQDQQLVDFCGRKVLCSIKLKASSTVQRAQSHSAHLPQSSIHWRFDISHVNTLFYLCLGTFWVTERGKKQIPSQLHPAE